jgi:hypothetical protein
MISILIYLKGKPKIPNDDQQHLTWSYSALHRFGQAKFA